MSRRRSRRLQAKIEGIANEARGCDRCRSHHRPCRLRRNSDRTKCAAQHRGSFARPTRRDQQTVATPESAELADRRIRRIARPALAAFSTAALNSVIETYCQDCHNENLMTGNLSLENFDVAAADKKLAISEKMIRKLRAEMMPLPGAPASRPATRSRRSSKRWKQVIDRASHPNPGARTFQRLNRSEYERVIRDLLGIEVNAGDFLPLDTKSANFDNIADVQALSPTLLEAYLNAAASVSRMAIGDRNAPAALVTHNASPFTSQHPWDHIEGHAVRIARRDRHEPRFPGRRTLSRSD